MKEKRQTPFMGHLMIVRNKDKKCRFENDSYVWVRVQAPPEGLLIRSAAEPKGIWLSPKEEVWLAFTFTELAKPLIRAEKNPEDEPDVPLIVDMLD